MDKNGDLGVVGVLGEGVGQHREDKLGPQAGPVWGGAQEGGRSQPGSAGIGALLNPNGRNRTETHQFYQHEEKKGE